MTVVVVRVRFWDNLNLFFVVFGLFSASPGAGAPPRRSREARIRLGGAPSRGEAENGRKGQTRSLKIAEQSQEPRIFGAKYAHRRVVISELKL